MSEYVCNNSIFTSIIQAKSRGILLRRTDTSFSRPRISWSWFLMKNWIRFLISKFSVISKKNLYFSRINWNMFSKRFNNLKWSSKRKLVFDAQLLGGIIFHLLRHTLRYALWRLIALSLLHQAMKFSRTWLCLFWTTFTIFTYFPGLHRYVG